MDASMPSRVPAGMAPERSAECPAARLYLVFALGGEVFGIDILRIREIIEYGRLSRVPMMPDAIRGVINVRGTVVPVIDLALRFGWAGTEVVRRTCIVIVEVRDGDQPQTLGIVVDAVNEVLEIPAADIEPAPGFGTRMRSEFITGMGKVGGRFVILLDLAAVLAFDELAGPLALAEEMECSARRLAA